MELLMHHLRHTLDLLITRLDDKLISQVRTLPELLSDHNVVACDINLPRPPAFRRSVSYRKTRGLFEVIYKKNLCRKILVTTLLMLTSMKIYTRRLFDKHTPILTRTITVWPHTSLICSRTTWENWSGKKGAVRENTCPLALQSIYKHIYKEICRKYNRSLKATKASYYKKKVFQVCWRIVQL